MRTFGACAFIRCHERHFAQHYFQVIKPGTNERAVSLVISDDHFDVHTEVCVVTYIGMQRYQLGEVLLNVICLIALFVLE